jgi:hypothetical protein
MKAFAWFIVLSVIGGLGYSIARWRRQLAERQRVSEQRFASFIAEVKPTAPLTTPSPAPVAAREERLLLEAAAKAGEAGEPVLSIQLYARLISRYPQTALAAQARAAVAEQKKKLAKA